MHCEHGFEPGDCHVCLGDELTAVKECLGEAKHRAEAAESVIFDAEKRAENWKQRDEQAEESLRDLACWLSVGGYNAETVDPWVFNRKVRDGVDGLTKPLQEKAEKAEKEWAGLLSAIKTVHAEHADDLCWMPADVNRIFVAAGLPAQDLYVGDTEAMLSNCKRYVSCLQSGGPWKSYKDLEDENKLLTESLNHHREVNVKMNYGRTGWPLVQKMRDLLHAVCMDCRKCEGSGVIAVRQYDAASGEMEFAHHESCQDCSLLRQAVKEVDGALK